jgi:hypothetical protein
MTSRTLAIAFLACGLTAACGNYSNEDLEFMAAVPTTTQLAVELPSALSSVNEAELARKTHDAIDTVNQALKNVLGLIDGVRTYTPTSRTSDSRTWGPFPDQNHAGWQWELIVRRDPADSAVFNYVLQADNPAAGIDWVPFLTGSFDGAGGASQGTGQVKANFAALLASQFPLDAKTAALADITITYQNLDTAGSPTQVGMTIDSASSDPSAPTSLSIVYEILVDGSGQMTFALTGNLVPGPATETVQVISQWLSSGAGEATLKVASGDGVGLAQTECWDSSFGATFNSKPWSLVEDVGTSADCPSLPALAPLTP